MEQPTAAQLRKEFKDRDHVLLGLIKALTEIVHEQGDDIRSLRKTILTLSDLITRKNPKGGEKSA